MLSEILFAVLTALLTAGLTIAAGWYLYHRFVKQRLVDWIDRKAEELGDKLRSRVREGVHKGIRDGLSDVGSDVVKKTKQGAVRTGFGMFEDSMNLWFGPSRRKPSDKKDDDR